MDIKDLNKTQLILLTLLITFVVSIATGIITVSLMQQMPKSVPTTINNVIQRTIEKVSTETTPITKETISQESLFGGGDALVSIYSLENTAVANPVDPGIVAPSIPNPGTTTDTTPKALGQGIIISDIGLVLVDSNILTDKEVYKVVLNKKDFDATIIKKFVSGFTVLKISQKKNEEKPAIPVKVENKQ